MGIHKTGSTAIQRTLHANPEHLRRAGFDYDWQTTCHFSTTLMGIAPGDETAPERERGRMATFLGRSATHTFLFSSERYCGNFLTGYSEAPMIARHLKRIYEAHEVSIVIYLRRQGRFLESAYAQSIRKGKRWTLDQYAASVDKGAYHGDRLLNAFSDAFGREAIHVRVYEKAQLASGSTVIDFLALLGGTWDASWTTPAFVNQGCSRTGLEIARAVSPWLPPRESEIFYGLLQGVCAHRPHDRIAFFTPEERADVLATYEETNAHIAREWLGRSDGKLFREPPDSDAVPVRHPEVPVAEIGAVLREMALWYGDRLPPVLLQKVLSGLQKRFVSREAA